MDNKTSLYKVIVTTECVVAADNEVEACLKINEISLHEATDVHAYKLTDDDCKKYTGEDHDRRN